MSKHAIGFWILIIAIAVHVVGNLQKAQGQYDLISKAATPEAKKALAPSQTDWIYYAATAGLIAGAVLLLPAIKPK